MADVWLVKAGDGSCRPMSEQDAERLKRMKVGEPFKAKVVKPRNGKHHRLGFSMLQFVFDNQERFDVFEDFLVEMKLRTGHYREHVTLRGKIIYVPMSLAFENMEEVEWGEWRSKAINAILKHFLPSMTEVEFEAALARIMMYC